jgi:ribonuclease J
MSLTSIISSTFSRKPLKTLLSLLGRKDRRDAAVVEEAMRRAVRREAHRIWGKKPHVEAIILSS